MSDEKEVGFTSEFWRRLKGYLGKYSVGGTKLDAKYQEPEYFGKKPDIAILDEKGFHSS
jgi:hypothetical protein